MAQLASGSSGFQWDKRFARRQEISPAKENLPWVEERLAIAKATLADVSDPPAAPPLDEPPADVNEFLAFLPDERPEFAQSARVIEEVIASSSSRKSFSAIRSGNVPPEAKVKSAWLDERNCAPGSGGTERPTGRFQPLRRLLSQDWKIPDHRGDVRPPRGALDAVALYHALRAEVGDSVSQGGKEW
jgi:hypothetical protein